VSDRQDTAHATSPALAAIVVAGIALRLLASGGDLWLDEIWSLRQVQGVHGALAALTIPHDNSHPLNALFLYFLGDAPQLAYRLLAVTSGGCTILLAAWIGRDRVGSLLAAGLIALSFPMLVYSSEARGYMPAVAAAMAAYLITRRILVAARWPTIVGFWIASVIGLLSHYAFAQVLVAIGAWAVWHLWSREHDRRAAVRLLIAMFAVPAAALALLYAGVLSHMRIGGGPVLRTSVVLADTIGWTLGLPTTWLVPGLLLALLVIGCEIAALRRDGDDAWLFLLVLVVVMPAVVTIVRPPILYARYFLLSIAFLVLALASLTTRLLRRGGVAAALGVALLALVCGGNAWRDVLFLREGRGSYRAALAWMVQQTPRRTITITSTNDFAVRQEVDFHARALATTGNAVAYQPLRTLPRAGADWLIVRRELHDPDSETTVEDAHGNTYDLRGTFPSYGPSGADWVLYARRP
jgi:hypothetical protein